MTIELKSNSVIGWAIVCGVWPAKRSWEWCYGQWVGDEVCSLSHAPCIFSQYCYISFVFGHQVDLAGSECIGRSGAIEKRAREAGMG